jgi:hypothetical protein
VEDTLEAYLTQPILQSCHFIDNALNTDTGGVFIHCSRGLSRSPAIVMAYLMRNLGMTLRDAYQLIKRVRPNIGPQCNFIRQLLLLERDIATAIPDPDAENVLRANRVTLDCSDFPYVPSLPLQVYALHESRCEDYERSISFLSDTPNGKRKEFWEKLSKNFKKAF